MWKAFCGYSGLGHDGKIYQNVSPLLQPVGGGIEIGPTAACGKKHGDDCSIFSTERGKSIAVNQWPMERFPRQKMGDCVGKTKRGKGTKIMLLIDGQGLPLGVDVHSATPHEVHLIEPLLQHRVFRGRLQRLIYDKAADSDPLRSRLQKRGIELICPHKTNRRKAATQDGRKLKRYRKRWKMERSISWLQNSRRVVTRYERYSFIFKGFVQLACLLTVLKWF